MCGKVFIHLKAEEEEKATGWKVGPGAMRDPKPRAGQWLAQGDTAQAGQLGQEPKPARVGNSASSSEESEL